MVHVPELPKLGFEWNIMPLDAGNGHVTYYALHPEHEPLVLVAGSQAWEPADVCA